MPRLAELNPLDPLALIQQIERTQASPSDPHNVRFAALRDAALRKKRGDDDAADAEALLQTRGGIALETAAHHAGFVLGFEAALARMAEV